MASSHRLEIDADQALFTGKIQGLILACRENERPLQGLAGLMDWRLEGAISRYLKLGVVTGRAGECVYLPISKNGKTYHLILAGAGGSAGASERKKELPQETLRSLQKNLAGLRLQQLGLSKADIGESSEEFLSKNLKGLPLWTVP